MRPLGKIKIHWSPQFAYAIGLLATDGNLSSDERHLNFTSKDRALVETFKGCLGIDVKIGKKARGGEIQKKYYQVQFGDVLFYRWLLTIGLSQNKSKTMGPLKVPQRYYFHFLRGCFDGDGSIHSYWDPRWRSSFMYYSHFYSASYPFIQWIQDTTKQLSYVSGYITRGKGVFQLRYAKKETLVLFQKMYYNKSTHFLKRKWEKFKSITLCQEHRVCADATVSAVVLGRAPSLVLGRTSQR